MKRGKIFFGKKGIVSEYLPWILISIAVLVILMFTIYILQGKGTDVLGSIKNLFRGG